MFLNLKTESTIRADDICFEYNHEFFKGVIFIKNNFSLFLVSSVSKIVFQN